MITDYDRMSMDAIIAGEGDWFTAHVIRFIDKVYRKADSENKRVLEKAFPDVVDAYKMYLLSKMWSS